MYIKHFGLKEKPFDVTPDPKFLYLSPAHREALAALVYGIQERRGFITIVGEVGTGKTTLLNALLARLDEQTKVAYIFNTDLTFEQLLRVTLVELELADPSEKLYKIEALHRLNQFAIKQLASGGNVVLIVDEAQNLDDRSMENFRLLSNLETPKHKLVQIVLCGQPELDKKLNRPELRQLAQRISLKRYITPLNEKETYEYIKHRLAIVNGKSPTLFGRKAQQLIWEYSGGIPRKINILCDNALLIGYGLKNKKIKAAIVEEAIRDMSWSPFSETSEPGAEIPVEESISETQSRPYLPFALAASLLLIVCLIAAVWFFYPQSWLKVEKAVSALSFNGVRAMITKQESNSDQSPIEVPPDNDSNAESVSEVASPSTPDPDQVQDEKKKTEMMVQTRLEETAGIVEPVLREQSPEQQTIETPMQKRMDEPAVITEATQPDQLDEPRTAEKRVVIIRGPAVNPDAVASDQISEPDTAEKNPVVIIKEPVNITEAAPSPRPEVRRAQPKFVVVRRGDSLTSILRQAYGTYSEELLHRVLNENSDINNPDFILTGQMIKLPVTGLPPASLE
jgi:type II secretory pathway predicted ATPase ExeA